MAIVWNFNAIYARCAVHHAVEVMGIAQTSPEKSKLYVFFWLRALMDCERKLLLILSVFSFKERKCFPDRKSP